MPCEVGSIRQVHRRLQAEGFLVSECALRRWIKTGELPAVFSGNKALISFKKVLTLLGAYPACGLMDQAQPDSGIAS